MIRLLVLAVVVGLGLTAAQAQQRPAAPDTAMPLLIVDQEELFLRSAFGKRIRADIAGRFEALAAENRRIEAELVAEEQALTVRRATMDNDEFAPLANEFDARVRATREAQDAKSAAIEQASDDAQQAFFARVARILGQIMRDRGAVAIVDGRAVLLSVDAMDITQEAIARIDAEIGDGQGEENVIPALPPADTGPASQSP
ncbi:OmpH family outer membrane protein [Oceaniglobus indicus]|uniref:OmpH family outer membrane protein n=1 Tax=Oceaniglobus indicus TaxID=2047749 RepID=UPI000C18A14A|nr:OmpH family outer membrane protein [Oceaniglobus indicus]